MSIRRGLQYGWWKDADFWVTLLLGVPAFAVLMFLLGLWFGVWTP